MPDSKTALKHAKAALDAHKYDVAIDEAKSVIEVNPKSYHAFVFLGLAYERQDKYKESEEAYRRATEVKSQDPLAWQGLVTLYDKNASESLDSYHDAALRLAEIYMADDDKTKCQTVIDKYTGDARKYGSRAQFKRSLEVLLPGSPVFEYLEGRIPDPGYMYTKVADLIEAEEKERINSEIGQRRTRLGARIDQVTRDVRREVLEKSRLEEIYSNIIDWTRDDEIRRSYEEKLLGRAVDVLTILQPSQKAAKRDEVRKMARGLVILKDPFLLAWTIDLEWSDKSAMDHFDQDLLQQFVDLFPEDGLAKIVGGFLSSEISPVSVEPQEPTRHSDDPEEEEGLSSEERLILMTEGLQQAAGSILAHRLMGQYYLHLDEYESVVSVARTGLKRVASESALTGLGFGNACDDLNSILASALIHYQSPRHHAEARALFNSILERNSLDTACLIGIGTIYEEEEKYEEAIEFLERALETNQDVKIKAEAAWCRALTRQYKTALDDLSACLTEIDGQDDRSKTLRSETLYRIGICIWSMDTSRAARKDRNGAYARFIASLQADMSFAPSYTSLGLYYTDYAKDKKRGKRCFQKAFELSASEFEAAHRLCISFAESGEWDLVDVVAQRVVETGRTRPAPGSKKQPISWPYAALGVVQLNGQEYAQSIVSFQSALRLSPDSYHCWIGLGEGYHNSGRYVAASKAFEHAQEIEKKPENTWFSEYMLANVKRELGEYADAAKKYREVLRLKPGEFGVLVALLQTLVDAGWRSIELGFFGRAAEYAEEGVLLAKDVVLIRDDAFNVWRALADLCLIFAAVPAYEERIPHETLTSVLTEGIALESLDRVLDTDGMPASNLDALDSAGSEEGRDSSPIPFVIRAAVLAQKRAIHVSANDLHARAISWYNLGWTEYKAHAIQHKPSDQAKTSKTLRAAMECFKRAIGLEAGNAEFWNSLGITTSVLNPQVAQHSFVRSLYLNDKNARVWTNLGIFYLLQKDLQLANEAFTRAQSADPDHAQAWLGQGLLGALSGDRHEARRFFTQAFEIGDSAAAVIKHEYTTAAFDFAIGGTGRPTDLLEPLLSLHQLQVQTLSDLASQHLSSLIAERTGNAQDSIDSLERVCSILEADYESSESSLSLIRFAQAKADLARGHLAMAQYAEAVENAETALDLSSDEADTASRTKLRLSAYLTTGLTKYYQGSMDDSIENFKFALSEAESDPNIVCLLAQVLWAEGSDNGHKIAREQLFDCIEKSPGHIGATSLLGCIAILDCDQDTIDAVTADLEELRVRDETSLQDQAKIAHLLAMMPAADADLVDPGVVKHGRITESIMLAPSQSYGWRQLASISDETFPAEAALVAAIGTAPPRGILEPDALCSAYAGTSRLEDAQRAVMLAPHNSDGWAVLG